ncbi:hypothetical protein LJC36_01650 [Desulfovibrio sp. OttesenSCG-928-C14]|nr:hypothetical protein [Desulfovibrio sp. OttesenSCG-928-C14]
MNARRVFRNIFLGHALVLLLVFLCPGVSAGQGQVKTYRFGPVLIDVPVKEGYSVDTKGKNLVVSLWGDGYVRGKYGEGHPHLALNAERTGKRGMTLQSYLNEHWGQFKSGGTLTQPKKVGDGVYVFYVHDHKIVVMQLAGTDILVWMQIGYETDSINKIIGTVRPAE